MNQNQIADKLGVSHAMFSLVKLKKRRTYNVELAKQVAKETGIRPIDHMPKRIHKHYLKLFPELGRKQRQK